MTTTKYWIDLVLPRWNEDIKASSLVRELCYKGIPSSLRGKIWRMLLGNNLRITPELYDIFKNHSENYDTGTDVKRNKLTDDEDSDDYKCVGNIQKLIGRQNTVELIAIDLPRTLPTSTILHDGGPTCKSLENILRAYTSYRPDIGYVQGMTYVSAMLCCYMDEYHAFESFANLVNSRTNFDFYRLVPDPIIVHIQVFNYFFRSHLRELHHHFLLEGVSTDMFLMDWYLTLFVKVLPLEVAARIWDVYLLEGEVFLLRAALGVLKLFHIKLLLLPLENIIHLLSHPPPTEINAERLLDVISTIRITNTQFNENRKAHSHIQGLSPLDNSYPLHPPFKLKNETSISVSTSPSQGLTSTCFTAETDSYFCGIPLFLSLAK